MTKNPKSIWFAMLNIEGPISSQPMKAIYNNRRKIYLSEDEFEANNSTLENPIQILKFLEKRS